MRGKGSGVEEPRDGFTSEGRFRDLLEDEAGARGAAEGDSDEVARLKL